MNAEPRTVTVKLLITKQLEIDEPSWCVDPHEGAQFKRDITHNGPEIAARVETPHGSLDYLNAWITTAPYGIRDHQPLPLIAVDLGADIATFDPDTLRSVTALTRLHLDHLDALADEAERLRGGGQ
ncbi:DUF6907 domain-containing protein [Streptomyces sp. NPDC020607]|uniref:DUF6907 domain-containing protein n=1 Tax=Streptomyces sp. NPDC020607 TaxID=3365082 RepID=UPI0037B970BD